MKFIILIVLAAFFGSTTTQAADPTATPPPTGSPAAEAPPKSTIPSDANYRVHPDFQTSWEDYLATEKGKAVDLIFIGDSITQQWRWGNGKAVWQKSYASRALDFGQGSDLTQNTIWRLKNLDVKEFKPKVAVILIGTNNFKDPPADIAAGVKAVITTTQETFPGVKIILCSILPNLRGNAATTAANEIIKTYGDDQTVYYLDLVPQFPPMGDNWQGLQRDHLHLLPAGYEAWAAVLNPLIEKLTAGQ